MSNYSLEKKVAKDYYLVQIYKVVDPLNEPQCSSANDLNSKSDETTLGSLSNLQVECKAIATTSEELHPSNEKQAEVEPLKNNVTDICKNTKTAAASQPIAYNVKWIQFNEEELPVIMQNEAVGHAVRAVYMYAGMTDIAAMMNEKKYLKMHSVYLIAKIVI